MTNRVLVVVITLLVAMTMASCHGRSTSPPAHTPTTIVSTVTAAPAAPQPRFGELLTSVRAELRNTYTTRGDLHSWETTPGWQITCGWTVENRTGQSISPELRFDVSGPVILGAADGVAADVIEPADNGGKVVKTFMGEEAVQGFTTEPIAPWETRYGGLYFKVKEGSPAGTVSSVRLLLKLEGRWVSDELCQVKATSDGK